MAIKTFNTYSQLVQYQHSIVVALHLYRHRTLYVFTHQQLKVMFQNITEFPLSNADDPLESKHHQEKEERDVVNYSRCLDKT